MQLRDWKYLQQNATRRDPAASACQSHKLWGVLNACASSSVAAALEGKMHTHGQINHPTHVAVNLMCFTWYK
jgi:hypothetical protein